jgi:hypothetical protein
MQLEELEKITIHEDAEVSIADGIDEALDRCATTMANDFVTTEQSLNTYPK